MQAPISFSICAYQVPDKLALVQTVQIEFDEDQGGIVCFNSDSITTLDEFQIFQL